MHLLRAIVHTLGAPQGRLDTNTGSRNGPARRCRPDFCLTFARLLWTMSRP